jgi:hypothetical protein
VRNPAALDPATLAAHLCQAFLQADAVTQGLRHAPETGTTAGETTAAKRARPAQVYPPWFGGGLARLQSIDLRQSDADAVLAKWYRARLPCFEILAASFSPYATEDAAIAAQLVAWFLDTPDRAARFIRLRKALVEGEHWTHALFARAADCEPELGGADAAWDAWLLGRRWTVLEPGSASPALVAHMRMQLVTHAGEPGFALDIAPRLGGYSPEMLAASYPQLWTRQAAQAKRVLVRRIGAGRDEAFTNMTTAYSEFFALFEGRTTTQRLADALHKADALLTELEAGHR